jgi:hypothetical protein
MSTPTALRNGVNLAYWLARVHPQLYTALAKATMQLSRFGSLGDDGIPIISDTTDIIQGISPDLISMPDPELQDVGVGSAIADSPVANIDTSLASDAIAATAPGASAATGTGSSLAGVGSFLASASGLTALTTLTTAIYKANTPQAQTIGTQVARVGAGVSPAPLTYAYNSAGQLVPVLSQTGSPGLPLSPQSLSSLVPSTWQQYLIPLGMGLLALYALTRSA